MCLLISGRRWVGLGVEMGGFSDQGVEVGLLIRGWKRVGLGIKGWRRVGLGVDMGVFIDQREEMFRGGDGWI